MSEESEKEMNPPAAAAAAAAAPPFPTVSQRDQWMVESQVFQIYQLFATIPRNAQTLMLELQRDNHMQYLSKGLRHLGSAFSVLDANRPWLCYWIFHSIALLGESVDDELEDNAIDFLNRCQDPNGGYAGGPGQGCFLFAVAVVLEMPHIATTYAAVNTLITLGGQKSLASINRDKLYRFLRRMKQPNGGFSPPFAHWQSTCMFHTKEP